MRSRFVHDLDGLRVRDGESDNVEESEGRGSVEGRGEDDGDEFLDDDGVDAFDKQGDDVPDDDGDDDRDDKAKSRTCVEELRWLGMIIMCDAMLYTNSTQNKIPVSKYRNWRLGN